MASNTDTKGVAAAAAPEAFTLQIISPSIGVPRGLVFEDLPISTTVRELKDRIREKLDAKPAPPAQRLIHRGRLLAAEDQTMVQVFGEDNIRSSEPHTLHLVLRDSGDIQPAMPSAQPASAPIPVPVPVPVSAPAPAPASAPATNTEVPAPATNGLGQIPTPIPQAQGHFPHPQMPQHQGAPRMGMPMQWPNNVPYGIPNPAMMGMPGMPGQAVPRPMALPPGYTPQQFAQQQHQMMATMTQQLNQQLNQLMQQNRGDRPANGTPEVPGQAVRATPGVSTPNRTASPSQPHRQPDATRTVVREGVGPNGQTWRITVNESVTNPLQPGRTGSPFSAHSVPWRTPTPRSVPNGGPLSGNDVHNMLRGADSNQATRVMADAMRRNASSSSLANLASSQGQQPIPPGVTTPMVPSRPASGVGTPEPARTSGFSIPPAPTSNPQVPAASSTEGPEVYILYSPTGPRAILLHGTSDAYFSPQVRAPNTLIHRPFAPMHPGNFGMFPPIGPGNALGATWPPPPATAQHTPSPAPPAVQPQTPQPPQLRRGVPPPPAQPVAPAPPPVIAAHPGNPHVNVVLAQLWPHIWMVVRLALFIWWFTSPDSSWTRWATVILLAVAMFFVNTGLLNPMAEQVWAPIRRHLENLIPLADHARAHENEAAANGDGQHAAGRRQPTPAELANRLVQERRDRNGTWLSDTVRRIERASILFIASIAPGVAERHIRHLENEARAERERRQAEEAAAAAAAAAAQTETQNEQTAETAGRTPEAEAGPAGNEEARPAQPAEEQLIAV